MVDHTTRAFDPELQELARKIAEMGALPKSKLLMRSKLLASAMSRWPGTS